MKGHDVIEVLTKLTDDNDFVVSSNGNISREVYHLLPRPQLYLRGSMGLPVSVGLGLALANPEKRILVITGDGNFLMGLGSMTTAAFYRPSNLKILILDNQTYFTTGGQKTVSSVLNYSKFFESLNIEYHRSNVASLEKNKSEIVSFMKSTVFSVLHLRIDEFKLDLENIPWHPEEISRRIIDRLSN